MTSFFRNKITKIKENFRKRKKFVGLIFLGGFCYLLGHVETTPYFERKRIMLISEEKEHEYKDLTNEPEKYLPDDDEHVVLLRQIGKRLLDSVAEEEQKKPWTFNLTTDPTKFALSQPGKNIIVHKKLFEIFDSEEEIAAILAHELSHSLIRHSIESVSTELIFFPVINLL